jgi:serine/threonine protein kinase/tetratricopeptide (TPR) repeat protein
VSSVSQVEDIFLAALEKGTPEDRAAYLEEACKDDPELRRRVERLLEAHPKAGDFLENPVLPPGEATAAYFPSGEPVGTVIAGRYKLLEQIGEGGMGTVWVAEQIEPVRRKVALKLIKAGMDSQSVLARFEAERQALALMDHPNIAKVLDGGMTEQGRPFFVMEYVKGVPLTQYCDDARLTVEERLGLFIPVCQAVQHAHQKGIVHRDLKPSNVLVCLYDGKPVPKVIDFGLAKAMHQPLSERTLHTAHGVMLGTPLYMSPEQAELNNLDVDTRTDVYSLGVILYELLTGTTPLEKQRFKEAAWNEMLRLIKEESPPRPSTRLSSTATSPSIAAQRQMEPMKLSRLLQGELDWIVMKALEKERGRRYGSPGTFAEDIERYLRREVVQARPPSASYRARKFVQRHRAAVITAAAFAVLLAAASIISTWQAIAATRAERIALKLKEESDKARDAETEARKKAELQGFVAQFHERRKPYQQALDSFLSYEERQARVREAIPGLADLLRKVPDHAPAWRDHLVMTVLLAGGIVAPPPTLPDRPGIDLESYALSGDGQRIITATNDGTIQVRDFPSLALRCTLDLRWRYFNQYGFLGQNRCVWKGHHRAVRLWDATTGKAIGEPLSHPGSVTLPVTSSPDGARLVTRSNPRPEPSVETGWHNYLQLWDARTAGRIALLEGPKRDIHAVTFHPNGSQIVAAGDEGLFVWSAQDGKLLRQIGGIEDRIYAVSFNPTGRVLAACTRDHLLCFQTEDWSRRTVPLGIQWPSVVEEYYFQHSWADGNDELIRIRAGWAVSFGGGTFDLGARVGSPALLGFAPHAAQGSFILAHNGDVYERDSGRQIVPPPGRKYPDEARLFAIDGRWLQLPDGVIDLAVEQPLPVGDLHRVGRDGVAWALVYFRWLCPGAEIWPLPEHPDALAPGDVALWAELLACGELGPDGRFRALGEAEWELRRQQFASKTRTAGPYRLPGFDPNDRLYWLRTEAERTTDAARKRSLLDRLIAEEPSFRNYLLRARQRSESGDRAGSLADQLEAARLAGSSAWPMIDQFDAFPLALQQDRPVHEYHQLLTWMDQRRDAGLSDRDTLRALVLYRLGRFDEAAKLMESYKLGMEPDDEASTAVLLRAMAKHRLGQHHAAKEDYQAARTAITPSRGAYARTLLSEAEKLFGQ